MNRYLTPLGAAASLAIVLLTLAAADPGRAPRGKKLFYTTAGCSGCHSIHGRGGGLGPNLSAVGNAHDVAWIAAKIHNPRLGKPDTAMPTAKELGVSDQNVEDLAAWLAGLK